MLAGSAHIECFPTVVWVADLEPGLYRPMNAQLAATLERMIAPRPRLALGGTWQTDPDLHVQPAFAELVGCIRKGVDAALAFLKIDYDAYDITGCWANINPVGAVHTSHTHPNNYLSGVYYVQVAGGADRIRFSDPRIQASMISPPVTAETRYTGNEMLLEAKDGRLVIFPAWLHHSVPVNRSDRERISISFNVMFTDFTRRMSRPKWTGTARPAFPAAAD
jgi:uncharacterized protein (TIGR02466 family)